MNDFCLRSLRLLGVYSRFPLFFHSFLDFQHFSFSAFSSSFYVSQQHYTFRFPWFNGAAMSENRSKSDAEILSNFSFQPFGFQLFSISVFQLLVL